MNSIKIELKWAFLFTVMSLTWIFLEKVTGLHDDHIKYHPYITWLFFIPAVLFYVLAIKERKKKFYKSHFKYKNALISGFILTLIITLLAPIGQYISVEYISPEYFENAIKASVESGYYPSEAEARANFNTPNYMLQSTIFALVSGIITTLIVSLFVRSK